MSCHLPVGCTRSLAQQAIDVLAGFPLFAVIGFFQLNPLYPSANIVAIGLATNAILVGYLIYCAAMKAANRLETRMHPTVIELLAPTLFTVTWVASFTALLASLGSTKAAAVTLAGFSALFFVVFRTACFLLYLFRSETRR